MTRKQKEAEPRAYPQSPLRSLPPTRGKQTLPDQTPLPRRAQDRRLSPVHNRGKVWKTLRILEKEGPIKRKGETDSYMLTSESIEKARE